MAVANPDEFEVLPAKAYADPNDFEVVSSPAQASGPQSASPAATDQISSPKSAPITDQITALPETVTGALAETGLETASGYKAAQAEALRRADEKGKVREESQDSERAQAAKIHDDLAAKLGLTSTNETAQAERDKLQRQLAAGPDESAQASEAAKALAEDAKARGETKAPGAVTTIARGLTKGAAMAAEAAIPGVGLPVMATQGATSAYGQAKAAGKSEHEAEDAGARTLIALAAFGGANKVVSSTITKLLGNAPALKVFLTQTFGQAAGNEATSRVISAYEAAAQAAPGKRMDAAIKAAKENDLGQIAQNLGFAVMGGAHESGRAPGVDNVALDQFAAQARAIPDSEFSNAIKQYRELPEKDPRKKVFEAEIVRRGEPDYVTSTTGTTATRLPGEPALLETPQGQGGETVSQDDGGESIEQIKAKMRAKKVGIAAAALRQAADSAKEVAPASAAAAQKLSEALKAKAEQEEKSSTGSSSTVTPGDEQKIREEHVQRVQDESKAGSANLPKVPRDVSSGLENITPTDARTTQEAERAAIRLGLFKPGQNIQETLRALRGQEIPDASPELRNAITGSVDVQEVPSGRAPKIKDPSELTPAVRTKSGMLTGEDHNAIIQANGLDPSVRESPDAGFVDKDGNFFSREQVAQLLPTGKPGEAHTSDLPEKSHEDSLLDEIDSAPEPPEPEMAPPAPNETPAPETDQEELPPAAEISPAQKRVNDIQADIAANTEASMKWKRQRAKDLAAAQKALTAENSPTTPNEEPSEPASEKEVWQKSRSEMGEQIAKHTTFIKQAVADGKPVPLSVLMEYEGRAWAEKALKNFSETEKAEAALESPYLRKQIEGELNEALEKKQMKRGSEESGASTLIPDIAEKVVAAGRYAYRKGMQVAEWTSNMVKAFGEKIRPYLASAWKTIAGDSEAGSVGGTVGGKKMGQGEDRQAFIASVGKSSLKEAVTAQKEAKAAGWDQEDAVNFAIGHLRSAMREQGKALDEESARKFLSPAESKPIQYVLPERSARAGDKLVTMDIGKFDNAFQKDKGFYVSPTGEGAIHGRIEGVKAFLKTGKPVESPEVTVSDDGSVAFTNGRHRYSVLRNQGESEIPMAMDSKSAANAEKFGLTKETKGGDSVEKRNQERDEKGREEGLLEPPPGEGETVQSPSPDPENVKLARERVDAQRAARGEEEIPTPVRKPIDQVIGDARERISGDATLAPKLISRIVDKGDTAISREDAATILAERRRVVNERNQWEESLGQSGSSEAERDQARVKLAEIEQQMDRLDQASRAAGSTWADVGNMYQADLRADYSRDALERKERAVRGRPLSRAELDTIQELSDKIKDLEKAVSEHSETERQLAEAQEVNRVYEATIADLKKGQAESKKSTKAPKKPLSESIIETVRSIRNSALERIRARKGKMFADPLGVMSAVDFADHALVGATYIAEGAVTFGKWANQMRKEFGKAIEPHLKLLYDASKEQAKNILKEAGKKKEPTPVQAKAKVKAEATAGEELSHKTVYELARAHIAAGVHGEDAVMKAVHADVQEYFPDATERDVRRAFSEYGKVKFPSKEAVKAELREIRTLTRLQESIDRETAGLSALHTGLQRDKATQAIREKQKALNELLKKRQGPPSPEKLASREEAKQTALKNAIADLDKQLRTGEKPERSTPGPDSPATEQLRSELGAMRDKLREIERSESPSKTPSQIANDARVKALKKSIDSLDSQLKTGEKPAAKEKIPDTPEVERMRSERDAMREKLKEIEAEANPPKSEAEKQVERLGKVRQHLDELLSGKREPKKAEAEVMLSAAAEDIKAEIQAMQELAAQMKRDAKPDSDPGAHSEKMQIKALEKSIEEYQRKTTEKDFTAKGKKLGPDSAKVAQLKEIRDSRRAMYEAVRDAGKPVRTPDEIYNERRLKDIAKRKADLEARIAAKDFAPRPKPTPKVKTAATRKAEVELAQLKEDIDRGWAKIEDANKPKWKKALEATAGAARFSALSGYHTLAKLAAFDVSQFIATPIVEGVGKGLSKVPGLRGVFDKATMEQTDFRKDMRNFYAAAATEGMKQAWRVLKSGKSEKALLHGKKEFLNPKWYDFFGRLHTAEKTPLLTGTDAMYEARGYDAAIRAGLDPNDEFVKAEINRAAWEHSQASILQENNKFADAVNALHARLEQANPKTKTVEITNHVISTLTKTLLTKGIVRTPSNYIAQTIARTPIGLATGLAKAGVAKYRGIGNLHPTEANAVARLIKVGAVGSAFFLLGAIDATKKKKDRTFGGYWGPGRKRDDEDVNWGQLRIAGHTLPHIVTHNPFTESAQMGSTMMRVALSKFRRRDQDEQGLTAGAVKAIVGLATKAPIASPLMRAGEARGDFLGDIASGLVPQLIQNIAEDTDKYERAPETTKEKLEATIPGLRENTPARRLKSTR